MKETYTIILAKLNRDKITTDRELGELVDDELNEYEKARYSRLIGQKYYIMDLIEFFEDIKNHLD